MKQLFILCIGLLCLFPTRMEARKYYCEIKGIQKELSSGLKIVFDFGESQVYSIWGGEIGKGFIHVHHIVPVSEIRESYRVDYEKDLIPVCPNCHAMLHRKGGSVDGLKEIINNK